MYEILKGSLERSTSGSARGFTLIELMIIIAIVAVLVALAVPAYNDYTIRTKVLECINNASIAKMQISEYRQSLGSWPPAAADAAIVGVGDTRFCEGYINYDPATGSFVIDLDEAAIDESLVAFDLYPTMTPTILASGFIAWNCGPGASPISKLNYLPPSCRN